ncbi:hypothetical protein ONE63_010170 [Megalurothrips usitatus]|uniref:Uncharacterized protein n=1 Tax=Megalurothrips usitatus TaxID=439358 RepID=A0AAV7XNY1_9NEOP|nr:hypothetical protein ONE63_010170 [Megalurothrips usitatus]
MPKLFPVLLACLLLACAVSLAEAFPFAMPSWNSFMKKATCAIAGPFTVLIPAGGAGCAIKS